MRDLLRTRWAAVGAAVAVSLGAGGVSLTQAALTSGEKPVYVSLDQPCRVIDTRPGTDNVGPTSTPISAGEANALTVQITGTNGKCTGSLAIPADAVGVAINLTAINNTTRSHFRVYPADASLPLTSNLNFGVGQTPIANKVDVGLSAAGGEIKIYNHAGTTDAAVDIFGYYIHHNHGGEDIVDESLTGADIKNNTVSNVDTSNEPGVAFEYRNSTFAATSTPTAVVGTSMRVPSDGYVAIEVTGMWINGGAAVEDEVWCQLQKGTPGAIDTGEPWFILNDRNDTLARYSVFSAHRVMPIAVADNPLLFQTGQSISLVCDEIDGAVTFDEVQISATFFASEYEPIGFIFTPLSTDAGVAEAGE